MQGCIRGECMPFEFYKDEKAKKAAIEEKKKDLIQYLNLERRAVIRASVAPTKGPYPISMGPLVIELKWDKTNEIVKKLGQLADKKKLELKEMKESLQKLEQEFAALKEEEKKLETKTIPAAVAPEATASPAAEVASGAASDVPREVIQRQLQEKSLTIAEMKQKLAIAEQEQKEAQNNNWVFTEPQLLITRIKDVGAEIEALNSVIVLDEYTASQNAKFKELIGWIMLSESSYYFYQYTSVCGQILGSLEVDERGLQSNIQGIGLKLITIDQHMGRCLTSTFEKQFAELKKGVKVQEFDVALSPALAWEKEKETAIKHKTLFQEALEQCPLLLEFKLTFGAPKCEQEFFDRIAKEGLIPPNPGLEILRSLQSWIEGFIKEEKREPAYRAVLADCERKAAELQSKIDILSNEASAKEAEAKKLEKAEKKDLAIEAQMASMALLEQARGLRQKKDEILDKDPKNFILQGVIRHLEAEIRDLQAEGAVHIAKMVDAILKQCQAKLGVSSKTSLDAAIVELIKKNIRFASRQFETYEELKKVNIAQDKPAALEKILLNILNTWGITPKDSVLTAQKNVIEQSGIRREIFDDICQMLHVYVYKPAAEQTSTTEKKGSPETQFIKDVVRVMQEKSKQQELETKNAVVASAASKDKRRWFPSFGSHPSPATPRDKDLAQTAPAPATPAREKVREPLTPQTAPAHAHRHERRASVDKLNAPFGDTRFSAKQKEKSEASEELKHRTKDYRELFTHDWFKKHIPHDANIKAEAGKSASKVIRGIDRYINALLTTEKIDKQKIILGLKDPNGLLAINLKFSDDKLALIADDIIREHDRNFAPSTPLPAGSDTVAAQSASAVSSPLGEAATTPRKAIFHKRASGPEAGAGVRAGSASLAQPVSASTPDSATVRFHKRTISVATVTAPPSPAEPPAGSPPDSLNVSQSTFNPKNPKNQQAASADPYKGTKKTPDKEGGGPPPAPA